MSDQPDHPQNESTASVDTAKLLARRRFTRAGLSAPIVLGTLASKPVLGQVPYNCTISGQISGNLSRPGDVDCNTLGYSPEYWAKDTSVWPAYTKDKSVANKNTCAFNPSTDVGTLFSQAFDNANAFARQSVGTGSNKKCGVIAYESGKFPANAQSATLSQVLDTTGTNNLEELGRQAIASLLNASDISKSARYPFTAAQVVALFNEVWQTGSYVHSNSPKIVLTFDGVLKYLRMINGSNG